MKESSIDFFNILYLSLVSCNFFAKSCEFSLELSDDHVINQYVCNLMEAYPSTFLVYRHKNLLTCIIMHNYFLDLAQ